MSERKAPTLDPNQPRRTYELMSFDPPVIEEAEELLPKEPEITQEDIENARRSGIQLGVEQGFEVGEKKAREHLEQVFAQAAKENDQAVEQVFAQLTEQFEVLITHQQQMMEIYAEHVLRVAAQVWSAVLPHYVNTYGTDEVLAMVKNCLSVMREGAHIVVRYPAHQQEKYEQLLSPLIKIHEGRMQVQFAADETLNDDDVRLSWQGGSAERSIEEILHAVQQLTENAITEFHAQQEKDRQLMAAASTENVASPE